MLDQTICFKLLALNQNISFDIFSIKNQTEFKYLLKKRFEGFKTHNYVEIKIKVPKKS